MVWGGFFVIIGNFKSLYNKKPPGMCTGAKKRCAAYSAADFYGNTKSINLSKRRMKTMKKRMNVIL